MRKRFVILVFVFLTLFMVSSPILSYLETTGKVDGLSAGIAISKEEKTNGNFSPITNAFHEVKYSLDNTYQNYLPYYTNTVGFYKETLRNINNPIYSLYNKSKSQNQNIGDISIINHSCDYLAGSNLNRYYKVSLELSTGEKVEFLETIAVLTKEEKQVRLQQQIEKVNRLVTANKEVNVCVYVAANMEFSEFLPTYIPGETSGKEDLDTFLNSIDASATVGAIQFDSVLDRVDRCYLTDHHWSAKGSYQGYCDIIQLFRKESTNILEPRVYGEEITVQPCKFYGSYARTLTYSSLWDDFIVADYDLPTFTSNPEFHFEEQVEMLAGLHIDNMNSNAYGKFFPEVYTIQYPENETGRNLLVIGDSYTQGFCELLASSFDNTYCFYWSNYQKLEYNSFIKENNITDVLIMLYGPRMLYNATNDYHLERIKIQEEGKS